MLSRVTSILLAINMETSIMRKTRRIYHATSTTSVNNQSPLRAIISSILSIDEATSVADLMTCLTSADGS